MATRSKPPIRRQRVTFEYVDAGTQQLVIARETWRQTNEYCVTCGKRGTWKCDGDRRLCAHCSTVQRLSASPERAADGEVYAVIARQLQLAEAAAA